MEIGEIWKDVVGDLVKDFEFSIAYYLRFHHIDFATLNFRN